MHLKVCTVQCACPIFGLLRIAQNVSVGLLRIKLISQLCAGPQNTAERCPRGALAVCQPPGQSNSDHPLHPIDAGHGDWKTSTYTKATCH